MEVFYKDKVIIFTSNNCGEYSPNEVVFFDGDERLLNISYLSMKLEYQNRLVVVYEDAKECFELFSKQFLQVSAAGGVVINDKNQMLLIYRNDRWDLPKGKLEEGENIEQCAVREVMEESGVEDITLGELMTKTLHIYYMGSQWHLKTTWWYDMKSSYDKSFTPQSEEGITEVRWVERCDLKAMMKRSYSTIAHVIEMANA